MNIKTIKSHLRIPHDLEDDLIEEYMEWAESTVMESITSEDNADTEYIKDNIQFKKAVIMLTSFYYEQRMPIGDMKTEELPYSVLDSIQKLRGNPKVYLDHDEDE